MATWLSLPVLEVAVLPLAAVPYYWHLPILIIVISLVYSATRFDEWGPIFREAVRWGLRLTAFLFAIVAVLYVVATYL
jgi:hypothetical protein